MIPKEVYHYDNYDLTKWLRYEAGCSNQDYFHSRKSGGLKLQQVPEEYASLLLFLKQRNIKTYLALGLGNGGSFATECFFMHKSLEAAIGVDNLAYGHLIGQNEIEILSFIENVNEKENIVFHKLTTDEFFYRLADKEKFDAIFIDADHSYEGAKRDYDNSLKHIEKGGIIIFHDINSDSCPGIKRLWQEAKQGRKFHEFISSKTCGIGVVEI